MKEEESVQLTLCHTLLAQMYVILVVSMISTGGYFNFFSQDISVVLGRNFTSYRSSRQRHTLYAI
jgi:hypothetical protein